MSLPLAPAAEPQAGTDPGGILTVAHSKLVVGPAAAGFRLGGGLACGRGDGGPGGSVRRGRGGGRRIDRCGSSDGRDRFLRGGGAGAGGRWSCLAFGTCTWVGPGGLQCPWVGKQGKPYGREKRLAPGRQSGRQTTHGLDPLGRVADKQMVARREATPCRYFGFDSEQAVYMPDVPGGSISRKRQGKERAAKNGRRSLSGRFDRIVESGTSGVEDTCFAQVTLEKPCHLTYNQGYFTRGPGRIGGPVGS